MTSSLFVLERSLVLRVSLYLGLKINVQRYTYICVNRFLSVITFLMGLST